MEKGNLRVDLNLSVKEKGSKELGTRREVKNINSFRNVEKAIEYEFRYQCDLLNRNKVVNQETLLWDDKKKETESIRKKEDAHDYRYFPEPDLPPLEIKEETIEKIKKLIPELPNDKRKRLKESYQLSDDKIQYLVSNPSILNYYELMCNFFIIIIIIK